MHLLSVQSKVPVNSFANNHNIPFIYSAPPQSLTIERDSPSDDEYEDPLLDDDMMYPGVSSRPARAQLSKLKQKHGCLKRRRFMENFSQLFYYD